MKTILFAGQQGIALRGHRDYGDLYQDDDNGQNDGNFRALLRFRIDAGDSELAIHMQEAAGNAKYISNRIQNELVECVGQCIEKAILDEVRQVSVTKFRNIILLFILIHFYYIGRVLCNSCG